MSAYTDRVERNLRGLEFVSIGACPGCDECREADWDYIPREDYDEDGVEFWRFLASADRYPDEDSALAAARAAYADAWHDGKARDGGSELSSVECGICGSRLAGSREVWHATHGEPSRRRMIHFDDACPDCVMYIANGDEPAEGEEV